jgi:hypothetical protein
MDTSDRGVGRPFEGPGSVASGLAGIEIALVMSLYFLFGMNTLGFLSIPTYKNLKDRGGETSRGLCLESVGGSILTGTCFPALMWRTHS